MVDHSALAGQIVSFAEDLDLHVVEYDWVDRWLPGYSEVSVEVQVEGKIWKGRSLSSSRVGALCRAGMEALERAFSRHLSPRYDGGMALHPIASESARIATYELFERDAFFCHYLTSSPFISLDVSRISLGKTRLAGLIDRLRERGVDLQIREMKAVGPGRGTVVAALGANAKRPFGVVLGLGYADKLEDSIAKAVLECLPRTIAVLEEDWTAISPNEFRCIEDPGPRQHFLLGLHDSSGRNMRSLFRCEGRWSSEVASESPQVQIETYPVRLKSYYHENTLDLVLSKATSLPLQDRIRGHLQQETINMGRLAEFMNGKWDGAVSEAPHPLG